MTIARKVRISGRVQGVYFRAWTRDQAERLGVHGWVRNLPDGSVEAHIQGEPAAVDQLIKLLSDGPPDARVSHVETEEAVVENLSGFQIRRR